jgi:hypothetical protein
MKNVLAVLMFALSCWLAGCGGSPPALSLLPLYKADEKPAVEPRLEGEWTPVSLSSTGVNKEKFETWKVVLQSDGCYQAARSKKEPAKPERDEFEVYRVCLVTLDTKLFFDQQLESKIVGRQTTSAKEMAPDMIAMHMVGRVWPQKDFIRLARLSNFGLRKQPETLQADVGSSLVFIGSTAQLREIMAQQGEDAEVMTSGWYLCRPDSDCSLQVVEDELARAPNDKDVLSGAAMEYAGVEEYDKAIALLNRRAAAAPPDEAAESRFYVGLARLLRRDFSGARGDFAAAQKENPKTAEELSSEQTFIGISYFLEERYGEAHTAFAGIKNPPEDSRTALIILDYASLLRMGRGKQAEAFLADQMARFDGDADQQLLLLRSSGRVKDFTPAGFTDEQLMQGDGVLYALVRLAKGDRDSARQALESTVSKTPKWDPAYLGAKIELERMGASPAASK